VALAGVLVTWANPAADDQKKQIATPSEHSGRSRIIMPPVIPVIPADLTTQFALLQQQMLQFGALLTQQQQGESAADLTNEINVLHNPSQNEEGLCMSGTIRTDDICPVCKKLYPIVKQCSKCGWRPAAGELGKKRCGICQGKLIVVEVSILCPACQTRPETLYLDFSWQDSLGKTQRTKFRRDPATGELFDSWQAVHRFAESLRREIDQVGFDPTKYLKIDLEKYRFENYIWAWFGRISENLAPGTRQEWRRLILKNLISSFEGRDIRKITTGEIDDAIKKFSTLGNGARKNILTILRSMYRDAHWRGDITQRPNFPQYKPDVSDFDWIDRDVQKKILEHIPESNRPFFEFATLTGLRPAEIRALKWDSVFFDQGIMIIKRTFSGDKLKESPKDGDWRPVPLGKRAAEILRQQEPLTRLQGGFVFLSGQNKPCSRHIGTVWRAACREAGQKITLYQGTKHSLMTQKLNAGIRMDVLAAYCGHSDTYVTQKYAKFLTETLRQVVEEDGLSGKSSSGARPIPSPRAQKK
jgi:integrase